MIIIDGKNKVGSRISISIDELLFELFSIEVKGDKNARDQIRNFMKKRQISTSRDVRKMILMKIVKPKLRKQYQEPKLPFEEKNN